MKLLYIHGYNGTPDSPKVGMLRRDFPKAEVIARQNDSIPVRVFDLLDPIARDMDTLEDAVIGNSLGGFLANYLPLRYGLPALLINPVVAPVSALKGLGCAFAGDYAPFEAQTNRGEVSPRSVLLAEEDEVLPYRLAYDHFMGVCDVNLLQTGGTE